MPVSKQILQFALITQAIAEAIKELKTAPSGHVYAAVMGHLSLDEYQKSIDFLRSEGKVSLDGHHVLTWIGGD